MDGKLSFWLFTNRLVNNVSAVKKGKNNYIIIDPAKDSFILTSITQLQYNVNGYGYGYGYGYGTIKLINIWNLVKRSYLAC